MIASLQTYQRQETALLQIVTRTSTPPLFAFSVQSREPIPNVQQNPDPISPIDALAGNWPPEIRRILKAKLDGHESLVMLDPSTYRADFPDGRLVLILWSNRGRAWADLTGYGLRGPVLVTHILKHDGQLELKAELTVASAVPISSNLALVEQRGPR